MEKLLKKQIGLMGALFSLLQITRLTIQQGSSFVFSVFLVSILDLLSLSIFPVFLKLFLSPSSGIGSDNGFWKQFVDYASNLFSGDQSNLAVFAVVFLALYLARRVVAFFLSKSIIRFSLNIFNTMRKTLVFDFLYGRGKSSVATTSDLIYGVQNLTSIVSSCLAQLLQSLADLIFIVVILSFLFSQFSLVLVPVFFALFLGSIAFILAQNNTMRGAGAVENEKNIDLISAISELSRGSKEIKNYQKELFFKKRVFSKFDTSLEAVFVAKLLALYPKYFFEVVILLLLSFWLVFSYKSGLQTEELISQGGVLAIAAIKMIPMFKSVVNSIQQLKYREDSILRVLEMRDWSKVKERKEVDENSEFASPKIPSLKNFNTINICNLSVKHPGANESFLHDITMQVSKGDFIGILGKSGSGKSTLLNALTGHLSVGNAEIQIDGNFSSPSDLAGLCAYVPQNPFVMRDTIFTNVTLCQNLADVNANKLNQSLELADCLEFVSNLPDGVESFVEENAENLSGGQLQRLCFARALYLKRKIICLDECTSALDEVSQNNIKVTIKNMAKNGTTFVVVSHDQDFLSECDKLFLVKDGGLIDC